MTASRTLTLSAAFFVGSAIHLSGIAQVAGMPAQMPSQMQPQMQPPGMRPMMGGAQMEAKREAKHLKHLEELKVFLQLQAPQEAAWQAFSSVMKTPVKRPLPPNPAEVEKMTTPERIDKMMAMKAERDAEMTKRMNATKSFYATLTPTQQKVFDTHTQKIMQKGPMGHQHMMHP
jgi:protein CpxP